MRIFFQPLARRPSARTGSSPYKVAETEEALVPQRGRYLNLFMSILQFLGFSTDD